MLCLSWVVVVYIPTRERSTYKRRHMLLWMCSGRTFYRSIDENGWRGREEEMLVNTFYCWAITVSGARTISQFHISLHHHHPQHLQFVLLDQRMWRGGERKLEDRKQEEQEWDWGRDQTWLCWGHPSMFPVCCWFLCLLHISHLSVEWGSGGEDLTKEQNLSKSKKVRGEKGEGLTDASTIRIAT